MHGFDNVWTLAEHYTLRSDSQSHCHGIRGSVARDDHDLRAVVASILSGVIIRNHFELLDRLPAGREHRGTAP